MIFDTNLLFSEDQAITATANSTNIVDFGAMGTVPGEGAALTRNLGAGTPLPFILQVTEAFNNLTNLQIELVTSANADLSSGTTLIDETILLAALVAGYKLPHRYLTDKAMERYLGVTYTVTGTAPSTGQVTAALGTHGDSA